LIYHLVENQILNTITILTEFKLTLLIHITWINKKKEGGKRKKEPARGVKHLGNKTNQILSLYYFHYHFHSSYVAYRVVVNVVVVIVAVVNVVVVADIVDVKKVQHIVESIARERIHVEGNLLQFPLLVVVVSHVVLFTFIITKTEDHSLLK